MTKLRLGTTDGLEPKWPCQNAVLTAGTITPPADSPQEAVAIIVLPPLESTQSSGVPAEEQTALRSRCQMKYSTTVMCSIAPEFRTSKHFHTRDSYFKKFAIKFTRRCIALDSTHERIYLPHYQLHSSSRRRSLAIHCPAAPSNCSPPIHQMMTIAAMWNCVMWSSSPSSALL